ncbi:MAG: hypothetical protein ACM3TR_01010 [Caulobacteraceae bacterium]
MELMECAKALVDTIDILSRMQEDKGPEERILIPTKKGRYINVYPYNFKMVLKAVNPNINEKKLLSVYRKLRWIITPGFEARNTNIIKVNGQSLRVITFSLDTINTIRALIK